VFSKANRRFSAVLIAIVVVAIYGFNKVYQLATHDKSAATMWGAITFVLIQLLAILRAVMSDVDAMRDRQQIRGAVDTAASAASAAAAKAEEIEKKTNGNLERAIEKVAVKVKEANDRPSPAQQSMPQDPEALRAFVEDVGQKLAPKLAERICDDIAVKAARVAAEAVRDTERAAIVAVPCTHANPTDAVFCMTCGRRLKPPADFPAGLWTSPAPPPKK
jgi:low affinity Fe/Cu permease